TLFLYFFFFFKQKTAYEIFTRLEFRRVLFRSRCPETAPAPAAAGRPAAPAARPRRCQAAPAYAPARPRTWPRRAALRCPLPPVPRDASRPSLRALSLNHSPLQRLPPAPSNAAARGAP